MASATGRERSTVDQGLRRLQFHRDVEQLAMEYTPKCKPGEFENSLEKFIDGRNVKDGVSQFSKYIGKSKDMRTRLLTLAAEGLSKHADDEKTVLDILRKLVDAATPDRQEEALRALFAVDSQPSQVSKRSQDDDRDGVPVIVSGTASMRISSTLVERNDILPAYNMDFTKQSRGRAIILNVRTFNNESATGEKLVLDRREGSDQDVDMLTNLFKWLKFDVKVEEDCQENLYETVKGYLRDPSHNYAKDDCFVCVLMSHGVDGCLYSAAGEKSQLDDIFVLPSNTDVCDLARGVPKLFFIQACRKNIAKDGPTDPRSKETAKDYRVPDDLLLSYATRRGCPAYRYPETGSHYVNYLVECIRELVPRKCDLSEILTEVSRRVKENMDARYDQSCSHENQLHKKVIFPAWDNAYA